MMRRRRATAELGTRQVVAAVVAVLALIFILQNTDRIAIEFFGADGRAPLWLVLLLAFIGGVVVGGLMSRRRV